MTTEPAIDSEASAACDAVHSVFDDMDAGTIDPTEVVGELEAARDQASNAGPGGEPQRVNRAITQLYDILTSPEQVSEQQFTDANAEVLLACEELWDPEDQEFGPQDDPNQVD